MLPDMSDPITKDEQKLGDKVLKRMFKTPPKPHDDQKSKESHEKKEKSGD
ncbi:MAG: hypothetical protein K8F25_02175 [Fimbriimonadaceae bacterium]|nr:hypothetical protein [Alphaproteobacteria bacterium]